MMIASVIVAVGLTEIVAGWGRLMRTRAKVSKNWLHIGWTLVILCSLIQYWTGMWSYSDIELDDMLEIFCLVIPSLFGVLAVYAITPDVPLEGSLDVGEYYWSKRRVVFLPLAAYLLAALASDMIILGVDQVMLFESAMYFAGAAAVALLTLTKNVWVHYSVLTGWVVNVLVRFFF